ncbi:uncharacterized protein LOC127848168 isoform X2 [Dreissena polymorpha]|uniref:uncharacterized protein LOC127848168 isoform X2 n=1 Tax=Dreissena polymorpha TaxID=45954 RepID=UPI002263D12B|nr:uncharacterized protein LOC127848168 isoform X2 [Dreissena polymorpha]
MYQQLRNLQQISFLKGNHISEANMDKADYVNDSASVVTDTTVDSDVTRQASPKLLNNLKGLMNTPGRCSTSKDAYTQSTATSPLIPFQVCNTKAMDQYTDSSSEMSEPLIPLISQRAANIILSGCPAISTHVVQTNCQEEQFEESQSLLPQEPSKTPGHERQYFSSISTQNPSNQVLFLKGLKLSQSTGSSQAADSSGSKSKSNKCLKENKEKNSTNNNCFYQKHSFEQKSKPKYKTKTSDVQYFNKKGNPECNNETEVGFYSSQRSTGATVDQAEHIDRLQSRLERLVDTLDKVPRKQMLVIEASVSQCISSLQKNIHGKLQKVESYAQNAVLIKRLICTIQTSLMRITELHKKEKSSLSQCMSQQEPSLTQISTRCSINEPGQGALDDLGKRQGRVLEQLKRQKVLVDILKSHKSSLTKTRCAKTRQVDDGKNTKSKETNKHMSATLAGPSCGNQMPTIGAIKLVQCESSKKDAFNITDPDFNEEEVNAVPSDIYTRKKMVMNSSQDVTIIPDTQETMRTSCKDMFSQDCSTQRDSKQNEHSGSSRSKKILSRNQESNDDGNVITQNASSDIDNNITTGFSQLDKNETQVSVAEIREDQSSLMEDVNDMSVEQDLFSPDLTDNEYECPMNKKDKVAVNKVSPKKNNLKDSGKEKRKLSQEEVDTSVKKIKHAIDTDKLDTHSQSNSRSEMLWLTMLRYNTSTVAHSLSSSKQAVVPRPGSESTTNVNTATLVCESKADKDHCLKNLNLPSSLDRLSESSTRKEIKQTEDYERYPMDEIDNKLHKTVNNSLSVNSGNSSLEIKGGNNSLIVNSRDISPHSTMALQSPEANNRNNVSVTMETMMSPQSHTLPGETWENLSPTCTSMSSDVFVVKTRDLAQRFRQRNELVKHSQAMQPSKDGVNSNVVKLQPSKGGIHFNVAQLQPSKASNVIISTVHQVESLKGKMIESSNKDNCTITDAIDAVIQKSRTLANNVESNMSTFDGFTKPNLPDHTLSAGVYTDVRKSLVNTGIESLPSLTKMIKYGLLIPGKNVLSVLIKDKVHKASLTAAGKIQTPDGLVYSNSSQWLSTLSEGASIKKKKAYQRIMYSGRTLISICQCPTVHGTKFVQSGIRGTRQQLTTSKEVQVNEQELQLNKGNGLTAEERQLNEILTNCLVKLLKDSDLLPNSSLPENFWEADYAKLKLPISLWESVDDW